MAHILPRLADGIDQRPRNLFQTAKKGLDGVKTGKLLPCSDPDEVCRDAVVSRGSRAEAMQPFPRRIPMSRARFLMAALGLAFALPAVLPASQSIPAGTWQSDTDETPLNAPHQEAVWGKNARELRTVRMVAQASGDATLTVTRRVVDAKGRTVSGTTMIEEVELKLGAGGEPGAGIRVNLPATVTRAERRYPDDPEGDWTIEGLKVTATAFPDDPAKLEVRLDFPDGRGSFWDELRQSTTRQR
jgi:hypothetical protein